MTGPQISELGGAAPAAVRLAVWSDYVCPFCYLEMPELERLQAEIGDSLVIEWRAFELRPEPVPTLDPNGDYLHRVWNASVYPMAAERGMALKLPPVQPRSRKAHETAAFARQAGCFAAVNHALFKAFFEDGRDIGDVSELADIARACGLDAGALRHALAQGMYTADVLADQRLAQRIGVRGVPAMLIQVGTNGYLLSGAQSYERLRSAIVQAADGTAGTTRQA